MCFEMALRFIIFFVGLVALQLVALHYVDGFQRIYAPFDYVVKRLIGDDSFGLVILWATLLGISIYSTGLAFVGAFLTPKILPKSVGSGRE